jgi:hypothetical protein
VKEPVSVGDVKVMVRPSVFLVMLSVAYVMALASALLVMELAKFFDDMKIMEYIHFKV